MEKPFSDISTQPYLNYNNPLFTKQSLCLDEINLILEQREELKDINLIYQKLITSNSNINSEEIEKVTIWARKIFQYFETENSSYYNKINTVDQRLKSLITNNDINEKKDALFSLQLYINYLTNCSILNLEEQKNQLAEKFNAVFSLDLEVCPGGIGSAFMNAMSSGIFQNILEDNTKKYIGFIPPIIESHFRPFLTNLISQKTSDNHQNTIAHFLSRSELNELFGSLSKGDLFDLIVKDIEDIHKQLIKSELFENQIIALLESNNIQADESEFIDFGKAINARDYRFLDAILEKYPNCFNILGKHQDNFRFFEDQHDMEEFFYPKQKIEFASWLIEKINFLGNEDLRKENLVKLIEATVLFGWEFLEIEDDKSQSFCDYFIKINNIISTDELTILLGVRNGNNETALHILAHNPKNLIRILEAADKLSPNQFSDLFKIQRINDNQTLLHILITESPKELPKVLETINTKIEGDQFLNLLLIEDKKYKLPILHILAIEDPEIFLKTLEIAQEKLNYEEFVKLLELKASNGETLLDILSIKNPQIVSKTIEIIDKKMGSDDLTSLLLIGDKTTALHNLARIGDPKYFINTLEILANKLNSEQLVTLLEAEDEVVFKLTPLHIMANKNPEEFKDVMKIIEKKLNSDEIGKLVNKKTSMGNLQFTVLDLWEVAKQSNSKPSNDIVPNNVSNVKNPQNEFTNKKQGRE